MGQASLHLRHGARLLPPAATAKLQSQQTTDRLHPPPPPRRLCRQFQQREELARKLHRAQGGKVRAAVGGMTPSGVPGNSPGKPHSAPAIALSPAPLWFGGPHHPHHQCALCRQPIQDWQDAHLDHRVPFSQGGASSQSNAQLLHKHCNLSKGARSDDEARARRRRK